MSSNNSPTFPRPSTGPTQYDAYAQAGQHPPGQHSIGPGSQGHVYPPPQVHSSRSNSSYVSPSNVPPSHPPAHIRGNSGYQPTPQMPQVPENSVPAINYGPPPMAHDISKTMQMPDHRGRSDNTTHPVPGPYSDYTPRDQAMSYSGSGMMSGSAYNPPHDQSDPRYQHGSSGDRIRDNRVPSSIQCSNSGMSIKGPPSGGTSGITGRADSEPPKSKICC